MSEREKNIVKRLVEELPGMSEHQRGYLEGTVATAAAMSKKRTEEQENEQNPNKLQEL